MQAKREGKKTEKIEEKTKMAVGLNAAVGNQE